MGFGRKYKDLPTPESVVWRMKIATRVASGAIIMIQSWEFIPDIAGHIITGILGLFVGVSRDMESMWGVRVPPMVKAENVEVVKDEGIKTIIFLILCGSPIFFN